MDDYDPSRPWEHPEMLRAPEFYQQVVGEQMLHEALGHPSENVNNRLLRRKKTMKTLCEVERTKDDVRFIVVQGEERIVYKLTGALAKSIGEELFKEGCNLIATQEEP